MTNPIDQGQIDIFVSEIDQFVDDNRERLFRLCADLVAARSVNPPGRTVEAAAVIEAFLSKYGIVCETLANVSEKPNLIAEANGYGTGSHLILNGHLDTVNPGRKEDWSVPIYELQMLDGKLTGLGIGNMKAGTASLALAFIWLVMNRKNWPGKISYTAVADETVFGDDGAGWLISQRPDIIGDAIICGEGPGDMNLALAEKGLLWIEIMANAPSGQGMLAQTRSSAITRLAKAIVEIDSWNDLQAEPPKQLPILGSNPDTEGLRLSVNSGTITGGHFVSQIATEAVAQIDFRIPPGLTTREIEKKLNTLCAMQAGLSWRRLKGWEPNWTDPEKTIIKAVSRASKLIRKLPPDPVVRLPASDSSRWRAKGVPAVCFGPQPLLVSGVNDFARSDDIIACAKIYALSALIYLNANC
ncbi:MAG: M20/M25/M40 family metallo-hydrolase [Paracoccaceae bacterium]|nr:M20/M25/M40 family metallo-hydrolase [Paracoccaceae bacterium]